MAKKPSPAKKPRTTKPVKARRSFRDLDPLEQGGRVARDGFDYQDHVAAGKCLDMLLGGELTEVWCEAEDDIVLVWLVKEVEWFEFVQVKGNDLGQAWTVSKLCEREAPRNGRGRGRCIVEKSLAHDRADDKCRFRVITRWNPDRVLSPLAQEMDTPGRAANAAGITAAAQAIEKQIGVCTSPNNNGLSFWLEMTVWEVRATTDDMRNANLLKLERVLEIAGLMLDSGQRERLYDRLYLKVQDASLACGRTNKLAKRLKRADLMAWMTSQANAILRPVPAGSTAALERKLFDAQISPSSVATAKEQLLRYSREVRQPKYLTTENRDSVESDALARLHLLKTQLDANALADNGVQFLNRCQQAVLAVRDSLSLTPRPADWYMLGYLYEVMNRCQHELVAAT